MKVQDKVAEIAKLCVEITMNTEHDVFFEYVAHVSRIECQIHHGGWVARKDWQDLEAKLNSYDTEQNLNSIIEQLQDLLK